MTLKEDVLQAVRQIGPAGWYQIDRHLVYKMNRPAGGSPNLVTILRELVEEGLLTELPDGPHTKWRLKPCLFEGCDADWTNSGFCQEHQASVYGLKKGDQDANWNHQ